jgi:hypothetical protein
MANFMRRVQEWELGRICTFLPLMEKSETLCSKQLYVKNCIPPNRLFVIKETYKVQRISKRKRIFLNNLKCENQKNRKRSMTPAFFATSKVGT